MPRVRLSPAVVTEAAFVVIDRDGLDAMSLSSVAGALGVVPSALYSHCGSLDGLRGLVAAASVRDLADQVRGAAIGVAGVEALLAMSDAYRAYARRHPGRFTATLVPSTAHEDARSEASHLLAETFTVVWRGMGLEEERAATAGAATRSAIHGHLALAVTDGSLEAVDDGGYRVLVLAIITGLHQPA